MNNLYQFLSRLSAFYWLQKTQRFDRQFFGGIGPRSRIIRPLKLRNPQNIFIGSHVTIADFVWLLTLPGKDNHIPKLVIGDGCAIGHFNHITSVNSVELGKKVLTADRVHISDNSHSYQNISVPIVDQPVISKGPVVIGEGTWVGENVSILSCRIGRNCVVGANAVVTIDVPDYCIVAGVPGRVIRKCDVTTGIWNRVEK